MSNIEWTDKTWGPVAGCTRVSDGCNHCYAVTMSHRLEGMAKKKIERGERPGRLEKYIGLTVLNKRGERHFNGKVVCDESVLTLPLRWRKPRMVFVDSMSDLFHEDVPFVFVDKVFAVMALCPQHTFQVLTKRPERMAEYLSGLTVTQDGWHGPDPDRWDAARRPLYDAATGRDRERIGVMGAYPRWPLPNVWLGTSAENQAELDRRIGHLLRCPAAVRFLSCEPLLGGLDLLSATSNWFGTKKSVKHGARLHLRATRHQIGELHSDDGERVDGRFCYECDYVDDWSRGQLIHWVIVGGESGKGARAFDVDWARAIRDQCREAGVAFYLKQVGACVVDRNDAGFEAETHQVLGEDGVWRTADPCSWPEPVDVEYGIDGHSTMYQGKPVRVRLRDSHGWEMSEWPEDLRVREFPEVHP